MNSLFHRTLTMCKYCPEYFEQVILFNPDHHMKQQNYHLRIIDEETELQKA